jgi:hypothetical protein
MTDQFNHRLGNIGNYLCNAQKILDAKVAETLQQIQQIEDTLTNVEETITDLNTTVKNTLTTAQQNLTFKTETHIEMMQHQMTNLMQTISNNCQYYESQIKHTAQKKNKPSKIPSWTR